ncbi:MAG TPA: hypothetical protein VGX78_03920 [Pirellulales bacterium]|jgi:hypothetical protein|nr:hypothetical protein [Pirellulales bacterium]
MKASSYCLFFVVAVLTTAGIQALPKRSTHLWASPQAEKFEDQAQFKFAGGVVSGSGTSIRNKGGFTVVPVEAAEARTKLSISIALKEEEQRTIDFRVVAVDAAGRRTEANAESKASASDNGIAVVTLVSEFKISRDKIDSLVIQRARK